MTQKTCEELANELHNSYGFDEIINSHYWSEDKGFTNAALDHLVKAATEKQIQLSDLATWDHESYFHNLYQSAEKGLS